MNEPQVLPPPAAIPNGKQLLAPGPRCYWGLVPDWRSGQLSLHLFHRDDAAHAEYRTEAALRLSEYDPRTTQSAMLLDGCGQWHCALSARSGGRYWCCPAGEVERCLASGRSLTAKPVWNAEDFRLGDLALLPDGETPCLAGVHMGGAASTLTLVFPLTGERQALTGGEGFRPPALHIEDSGLLLAWADVAGRLYFQRFTWKEMRKGKHAPAEVVAGPGRRPSLLATGGQVFLAYESLYGQIETRVLLDGQWQAFPITSSEPRFTVDVCHSAHLALDGHGVVWLFFSDANRCFTYYARWLGTGWSQVFDARGIFQRAPYYDSNLLSADFFSVAKSGPDGEMALLMGNAASGVVRLDTIPVVQPVAASGACFLFLDLLEVAQMHGLEQVLLPPVKDDANPVFTPNPDPHAFDGVRVFNHGTVRHEQGRFRMWYAGMHREREHLPWWHWLEGGYAESEDGRHWVRPRLGLAEWRGSRDNNLLPDFPLCPAVFFDEQAPDPQRRYKMIDFLNSGLHRELAEEGRYDLEAPTCPGYLRTSPDGIHWTREPLEVSFPGGKPLSLVPTCFFRDDLDPDPRRRWKAYGFSSLTYRRRGGALAYSPDCVHWEAHPGNPILEPRTSRQPIVPAGQLSQIHDMTVWQEAGLYLCLFQDQRSPTSLPLELAVGRDGEHFVYPAPGQPFLSETPPGRADSLELLPSVPLRVGEEMWFYYAVPVPDETTEELFWLVCAGLARSRAEGYMCVQPCRPVGGSLTTVPLQSAGPVRLWVNASCHAAGPLRVELTDSAGVPLPGYGREQCLPVTSDGLRLAVSWQSGSEIRTREALRVRFLFGGPEIRLFAFGFEA